MSRRLLQKVQIKNFKSLASVATSLGPFTVLVGPNGAGKSNFVDALRFVSECLRDSVVRALQSRGGINAVRRRSRGHPTNFGFRLSLDLEQSGLAEYSFEIAAGRQGGFTIKKERCVVWPAAIGPKHHYQVENGQFTQKVKDIRPRIEADSLALPLLSAVEEFRPVYDFITNMRFYTLIPDQIRYLQEPDKGDILKRDGSNAAVVLREIAKSKPDAYDRLCKLLSKVVPGTTKAEYVSFGQKDTISFKQDVGDEDPWNFDALSMSDGTLRVLGILLAVYQVSSPSLIAIEEPESTIHPAALDVLVDILKDGASYTQMLITTHSPDLLDNKEILDVEIRTVNSQRGKTVIAPLHPVSRDVIREHLYTAGELLKMDELRADDKEAQKSEQLRLFGAVRKAR